MIIFLKTLLLGQYNWMDEDLSSVDRSRTPWIIFIGSVTFHNSSDNNSSHGGLLPNVDSNFVASVEPLLLNYQVKNHSKNHKIHSELFWTKKKGLSDLSTIY
jgi:hypothetical protein